MPDLIDQIMSRALSRDAGAGARRLVAARKRRVESLLGKRADLLAQPDLLEKRVAAHAGAFSLSTRRPRTRRFQSKVDALEEQAKGTPQAGFASELMQEYTAALQDPNYLGLSNRQLLAAVSQNLMRARPEGKGSSRLEKAYRYKWRADTSLGNLFGAFGEDKDVRALPGYEQYLEKQKELPVEEWHTGPGEAAAIGAGFTAALMAGSKILGRAAMVTPAPGARIVGGALLAIPEFMAFDAIHNVIAKTEWGRAREGTWRKIGADLLAGGVVIGGGYKATAIALRKAAEKAILSKTAIDILSKHPTAKSAIEAGKAQRAARAATVEVDAAMEAGISKEDVLSKVMELESLRGRAPGEVAKAGEVARLTGVLRKRGRVLREEGMPAWLREGREPPARGRLAARPYILEAKGPIQEVLSERARVRVGGKTAERVAQEIAKVQMPLKTMGAREAGKAFAKLPEKNAERALKKAGRKGTRTAVAEEARLVELEKKLAEREETYLQALMQREDELEAIYLTRLEAREAALEETYAAAKVRAKQRTKVKAKKKVQKDVEVVTPGRVMAKEEVKAGLLAARKVKSVEGVKGKVDNTVALWLEYGDLKAAFEAGRIRPGTPQVRRLVNIEKELIRRNEMKQGEGLLTKRGEPIKVKPKVTKVSPEATGLADAERAAMEAVENEVKRTVSLEEAGLVEAIKGGVEETLGEGVERSGKDLVDIIKDSGKLFGAIGLFGSVTLASLFEPDSAEASMFAKTGVTIAKNIANAAKGKTKEAMAKMAKSWKDAGFLHIPAADGAKEKSAFQEVLRTAPMAIEEHGSLVKNVKAEATPFSLVRVLSPYTSGEILYKTNPVPEIGMVQSAIGNNAGDALKVVGNIFRDVPNIVPKGAAKDIMQTMSPVAKRYSGEIVALRAVEFDLDKATKSFDKLYKALVKEKGEMHIPALEKLEERMARLTVARDELAPVLDAYLAEWETAAQGLAKKYPTTRIALAAEDTVEYTKYPWLKGLITPEEEEAVVWLKNLHETYAVRMAETGHKVIEGPYVHHAWHPDWLEEAAVRRLKEFGIDSKGVPFSKFYHRAKYSRMMMPDINYTMQRYAMDAERRIQWSQFWGKGRKDSWYAHKRWVDHFGSKDQQIFWRKIADGSVPPAPTRANVISNIYTSFEVLRLLAFSPSVALKHYFKNVGTMSAMGVGNFMSHLPEAMAAAVRGSRNSPEMKSLYKRFGVESPKGKKKLFNEVADSFITQIHRMNMIADLDFESVIPYRVGFWQAVTKKMQSFNRWGSIPVRAIESLDRHHTVVAAWEMAAKKGMTAQQAVYGIYSNILKLNFLSGAANPSWIRNPKIRAMVLFQNTVFKIMERRLMVGWRAGKDVKTAIGVIRHQNIPKTLKEMGEIGRYVLGAEREMKQNMIFDALTASKDVFGTPMLQQAMREAILSGAILMGGGIVGMNLMPQVYHMPLLRTGAKAPTLAINPFLNAAFRTAGERETAAEYGIENDFLITQFTKNWLKSTGYLPQTLNKVIRITQDDVPEIYKGSRWQYFFSVPAAGEHY